MSMTISSSTPPPVVYSTTHTSSSFSFKGILKVLAIAAGYFQTGITVVSAEQITVYPAKLPDFCKGRYDLTMHGIPFEREVSLNVFCYLDSVNLLGAYANAVQGEERMLAEFNYGRRLACPHYAIGWSVMSGAEARELAKRQEKERLEGLERMFSSGCLQIIYPEKGETLKKCLYTYIHLNAPGTMHYPIENCWYIVNGVLVCPDEATFKRLEERFCGRV